MGQQIEVPEDLWHLTVDDLFAPPIGHQPLGGSGPYVINLTSSNAPLSTPPQALLNLQSLHVYQVERADGNRRYWLRLGPINTELEADVILDAVRDYYPGALTAIADDDDLRKFAAFPNNAPKPAAKQPPAKPDGPPRSAEPPKPATPAKAPDANLAKPAKPTEAPKPATPAKTAEPPKSAQPVKPVETPRSTPMQAQQPNGQHSPAKVEGRIPANPAPPPSAAAPVVRGPMILPAAAPAGPARPAPAAVSRPVPTPPASTPATAAPPAPSLKSVASVVLMPTKETTAKPLAKPEPPVPLKTAAPRAAIRKPVESKPVPVAKPRTAETTTAIKDLAKLAHQVPQVQAAPMVDLESTQTFRALTPHELSGEEETTWLVVQLAAAAKGFRPEDVLNLDIFKEFSLYSARGLENGAMSYALRLGFFSDEASAAAVCMYVKKHFGAAEVKRVSNAERERFAEGRVTARRNADDTDEHAVIELSTPPPAPSISLAELKGASQKTSAKRRARR